MNDQTKNIVSKVLRVVIAIIYVQTLYFKFSGHPDSVYIFSKLGLEPYGRIGIGVFELITAILLILPATYIYGIVLSLGVISGAIASHLGPLGIEVLGDGGKVFYLAVVVWVASILLALLHREEIKALLFKYIGKKQ
ncbi:MAG TPA: DoxX family protein [Saprospiraceae bacterium]|nr:DoxX family protein [Saprospiraceae bacterium]HRG65711.1 DoxX family protein [Saprospiraceae bacterium]